MNDRLLSRHVLMDLLIEDLIDSNKCSLCVLSGEIDRCTMINVSEDLNQLSYESL